MKLQRHPQNPILLPEPTSSWECENVFNPGVIWHDGLFYMYYRAQGLDWISRIGCAVSPDGIHWNRFRQPILEPCGPQDNRGVEDARITEIDGVFYMTYTAFSSEVQIDKRIQEPGFHGGSITPMIARSTNLLSWERIGHIVTGEDNKDHVLFPRKLTGPDGRRHFAALHRRRPQVWIAYSDDLVTWPEEWMSPLYGPRLEGSWDQDSVGSNGVPIETSQGWLMINHAYDSDHVYRMGVILLDLEDPTRIIRRPKDPIFWPEEIWELKGDVPNVVFSCASPVVNNTVYVFYGGADHVIALATCALDKLVDYALKG
jgi:beta-1,2-mannobiose phosphorylase / 1,2-beta-oligomannan phosphorylase